MEYDELERNDSFSVPKRRKDTELHRIKSEQRKTRITKQITPMRPACAFLKFVNEKIHEVRKLDKRSSYVSLVRSFGVEWSELPDYRKRKYIREAAEEAERHKMENKKYEQTEAFRTILSQRPTIYTAASLAEAKKNSPFASVPIFTKEFMESHSALQGELQSLRKEITELEKKNESLQEVIGQLREARETKEEEHNQQLTNNASLQAHLNKLREVLHSKFANLPLPRFSIVPSLDVIDDYMQLLNRIVAESSGEYAYFVDHVKEILRTIDFDKL